MGELSTYSTLEEKENNFSVHRIDTKKQFDDFYESVTNEKDALWRGLPEAKYKLYTSLQRFWIQYDLKNTGDDVYNYLEHALEHSNSWNEGLLSKFFLAGFQRQISIHAQLSILRHYGAPMPLSDWTKNAKVAMFFGAENPEMTGNTGINNYFSVYKIEEGHFLRTSDPKASIVSSAQNQFGKDVHEIVQTELKKIDPSLNFDDNIESNKEAIASALIRQKGIFLSMLKALHTYAFKIEDKSDDPFSWDINTNYNIIYQNGVFILNIHPDAPIEEIAKIILAEKKADLKLAKKISCYDINKSLKHYVLKRLNSDNITRDYLFPDLYDMSRKMQVDFLQNSPKNTI
jgi:hypothetical protein